MPKSELTLGRAWKTCVGMGGRQRPKCRCHGEETRRLSAVSLGVLSCHRFLRKVGSKMASLRGSVWEMGFEERGEGKKSHPVELFPNFDIFLSILMNLLC